MKNSEAIAGRTLDEWVVFARRDDCLDRMVPSDLRQLIGQIPTFTCAARKQSLPEPADCNWPSCGCDPMADKVIEALRESGLFPAS
jgi:hypothetical protein